MEGVFQGRSLHIPSFMYLKLLQLVLTCRHIYATISPELPYGSLNTGYELELEFPKEFGNCVEAARCHESRSCFYLMEKYAWERRDEDLGPRHVFG